MSDVEAEDAEPSQPLATVTPMTTARRKNAAKAGPPETPNVPPIDEPIEAEPVLDDDVVDAEIVEDDVAEPEPRAEPAADAIEAATAIVTATMDAEIVEERLSGAAKAREALNAAKAEKAEAPISAGQLKALQAGFVACGIKEREERLRIAAILAGRPDLGTANELTSAQARNVIDALGFAQATTDPQATLEEATS
jgi:hypothetical protein